MKNLLADSNGMDRCAPARGGGVRDWQRWAPYAAVAWSLIYAALGLYWAAGGGGFPYIPETASYGMGPLLGQFGPGVAWVVVILAGLPAAALGAAMLRTHSGHFGVPFEERKGQARRALRSLFITSGALLAGALLLLMTGLNLLVLLGYVPYVVRGLFTGDEIGQRYLLGLTQWTTIHQVICLIGGFLWLAATVCYARRSGDACLYCGRRDGPPGWQGPERTARWGRTAVYMAMIAPVFYAFTRYAWALGFPLGMTEQAMRQGQLSGIWISGLFLATFGLVGAVLMLGLVQRWGELFPRWLVGLAGRRVPIALAVVPAALVSVLLMVGGIAIGSGLGGMAANLAATGVKGTELFWEMFFQIGPTLLFPVWGGALAVAALGYYYRRRGPCNVCGRGGLSQASQQRDKDVV
jgi:hypothetical protein